MASAKLTEPTPRRRVFCDLEPPFPVPLASVTGQPPGPDKWCYYTGHLVGNQVIVEHSGDMDMLYKMGFFGKASLSRFRPEYNYGFWGVRRRRRHGGNQDAALRVMSRRKYMRHLAWSREKRSADECSTACRDLEMRPLARKKAKKAEPSAGACDWPPALRDTQSQEALERMDQPGAVLQEPSVSSCKDDADWPEVENDPWAVGDTKEAAEFWGATPPSTKTEDSKDVAISSPNKDPWTDISEHQDNSTKIDLVKSETSHEKVLSEHTCVPTKLSQVQSENRTNVSQTKSEDSQGQGKSGLNDLKNDTNKTAIVLDVNPAGSSSKNAPKSSMHSGGLDSDEVYDDLCLDNDEHPDLYVVEDTEESDCELDADAEKPWKPVRKREPHQLREHLLLTFEEAFFLSYGLGCLVILDEDQHPMNLSEMWQTFSSRQSNFIPQYIAYHSLRSKGWVPKEGIKFGVDFLVYRHGPAFYHSSYCVLVRMVDEESLEDTQCQLSWRSLMGLTRTTEGVGKEVMMLYVIRPSNITEKELQSPKVIPQFKVKEVVVKRWVSQQEREGQSSQTPDVP